MFAALTETYHVGNVKGNVDLYSAWSWNL